MKDERTLSLAIPTWNRTDILFESFVQVYDDPRVSEIIIVDDCSDMGCFNEMRDKFAALTKIKLIRNITNVDCYQNKYRALSFINNEFGILLDSDNVIGVDYLDKIFEYEWRPDIILTPDFAQPNFNFKAYSGLLITKENVAEYIDKPMFETMLNAANYFVNRDNYVKVWDDKVDPVTSDSIFQCYNWLAAGNKIHVVPNLHYFHRVHRGHYQTNVNRTAPGFHESILNKLRQLNG
jgi:glycosyltransferase involved in cell wall biosynthesis